MNRSELKYAAKQQIKGKIGILFLISLVIALVNTAVGFVFGIIPFIGTLLASIASLLLASAFGLSVVLIYFKVNAGNKPEVRDAFTGFEDFWSAFKLFFFIGLFTFLWSLLFIIPGIVKLYSYSMAPYILAENKGKSALECIRESKAMTFGRKGDLFVLSLSFIGWALLGSITLGIAYIWITPYMQATWLNAYQSFKPAAKEPAAEEPAAEAPAAE